MSLIASTPNIDIKYLEKILLEKVKYVVAEISDLTHTVLEVCRAFTALHAACLLNNLELVKFLVERGVNVNVQTRSGLTPLHVLLNQPKIDTDIVDYLINHGADLTLKDSRSQTLLYIAVKMFHMAIVRIILQHPCDIDALCGEDETALMAAASEGDLEMVKVLLANGADPNIIDYEQDYMAIHYSVFAGNEDIFKCLLDVSNCECICKCEPLAEIIIQNDCTDCLKVLLKSVYKEELILKETCIIYFKKGINNIRICEKYKKSSLLWYVLGNTCAATKEMFSVAINEGFSVNSTPKELIPPLTVVVVMNSYMSLDEPEYYIEKLINHCADVNYPQPESSEALPCSLSNHQVTLLLLQHSNFATPDSVLDGYIRMNETSNISSEVINLFLKLGMTPSTVSILITLPFSSENIPNCNILTQNVCTLKQLCRITLTHFFCAKYENLSIKEILNNLHLPDSINKYLRYEIL